MELEKNKCCFCGKEIDRFSTNDARPIKVAGLDFAGCCDECNVRIVIPTRISLREKAPRLMCKHCGDIIQSKHRHDMVWCKCGKVGIDGGTDYIKITGNKDDWEYV